MIIDLPFGDWAEKILNKRYLRNCEDIYWYKKLYGDLVYVVPHYWLVK